MKIHGLTHDQFIACVHACDPNLQFKVQGTAITPGAINHAEKVVEGYLCYPAVTPLSSTVWKAHVAGKLHHKPCGHMACRVIAAAFKAGAVKIFYEHILVTKTGMLGTSKKSAILQKLASKGISCECPDKIPSPFTMPWLAPPIPAPTSDVPKPPKPPKVKAPKPTLGDVLAKVQPINGQALTDGEVSSTPKGCRDAYATVTGLYVLAELDRIVAGWRKVHYQTAPNATSCTHRRDVYCESPECPDSYDPLGGLKTRVIRHRHVPDPCEPCAAKDAETRAQARAELSPSSAEQILINGGLASYREEWVGEDSENINVSRRVLFNEYVEFSNAYKARMARNLFDYLALASVEEARYNHSGLDLPSKNQAVNYDPRTWLPQVEKVFESAAFSGGYGGPKWAAIAKGAGYFYQFASYPVVFADHVVDLTHNGNVLFNKGYIFDMFGHNQDTYLKMLDYKRSGSLLDGKWALTLTAEVYLMACRVMSQNYGSSSLKVKQIVQDHKVSTVRWGDAAYTLNATSAPVATVHDDDDDESQDDSDNLLAACKLPESTRAKQASQGVKNAS